MTREDFETCINQINNTLSDYWPCCLCMACGYAFCVCTAGLSLFCPKVCINDVRIKIQYRYATRNYISHML